MNRLIDKLLKLEEPQQTKSFAAFRIGFALFLLVFITHLTMFRPVLFNTIPNLTYNPFPAKLFLLVWFAAAFALLLGWQTRIAAVVNYLLVLIAAFSFSNSGCGSFNDDLLRIGSFLLIFMPVSRNCSIDAVVHTLRYGRRPVQQTSSLYYLASLFVSLGLMYFASSLTKIYSPMWFKGLGLWIPASMPYNKWNNLTFFLDQEIPMKFMSYFTVAWEFLFIFVLFVKRWRWVFAILGVIFHLGIAVIFPFPLLCFGPIPFYFLFLGNRFWNRFHQQPLTLVINAASNRQVIFSRLMLALHAQVNVDASGTGATLSVNGVLFPDNWAAARFALQQTVAGKLTGWLLRLGVVQQIVLALADDGISLATQEAGSFLTTALKRWTLAVFCVALLSVQLFYSSYHLVSRIKGGVTIKELKDYYHIRKDITDFSLKPSNLFRTLFGLNARGVFLDHSNMGTKTVFAIVYVNAAKDTTWLPFFDRQGHCLSQNMNLPWSKYSFNSVCSGTIPNPLELQKTLWFWADKNHVNTDSLDLQVLRRTYAFPALFERGYYQRLRDQPWEWHGTARWRKGKFDYRQVAPPDSVTTEDQP